MSGKTNRNKGHSLERDVAFDLRSIGLSSTKTSRQASRLYDNCGIDHWGAVLPNGQILFTQCKRGYTKVRPKADIEFKKQHDNIKKNFPQGSAELNPNNIHVLIHKMSGKNDYENLVTMKYKDFINFLKIVYNELSKSMQENY